MKTGRVSRRAWQFAGCMAAGLCLPAVLALPITFEEEGYVSGSKLKGNGWTGDSQFFQIAAGEGSDGSVGVVTEKIEKGAADVIFNPTELPDFDGNRSVVEVGFKFRFTDTPDSSGEGVAVVQFGFNAGVTNLAAARFGLRGDGSMTYSSGASSSVAVRKFRVSDAEIWTSVTAVLNYATKEYTFSINGEPQGGVHRFQGSEGFSDKATIRIQNIGSPEHKSIAFDDFAFVIQQP